MSREVIKRVAVVVAVFVAGVCVGAVVAVYVTWLLCLNLLAILLVMPVGGSNW